MRHFAQQLTNQS